MNAVMREPYEAPVITNETIEANISFIRSTVDDVKAEMKGLQTDNRSLRDKIDTVRSELILRIDQVRTELTDRIEQVRTELIERIDQVRTELGARIDQLGARLDGRIDQLEARIERVSAEQKAGDEKLGAKIDLLAEKLGETNVVVAKVATMQKIMLWLIGGGVSLVGLIEGVIRLGEKFHWF
jgi:chromosome segregation ATPase